MHGDKVAVDGGCSSTRNRRGQLRRLHSDDPRYVYETGTKNGKRVQALAGRRTT